MQLREARAEGKADDSDHLAAPGAVWRACSREVSGGDEVRDRGAARDRPPAVVRHVTVQAEPHILVWRKHRDPLSLVDADRPGWGSHLLGGRTSGRRSDTNAYLSSVPYLGRCVQGPNAGTIYLGWWS